MAQITNVNPQEMLRTATTLKGEIEQWVQAVTKIFELQGELDGMWDGTANDAFNAQWAEDRTKYDRLSELMNEYCDAITNAANTYIEREEEVRNIIG